MAESIGVAPRSGLGAVLAGAPPAALTIPFAVAVAALVLHAAHTGLGLGGVGLDGFVNDWLYNAAMLAAAGLVLARGVLVAQERAAWLILGIGVLLWAAGDIYYTAVLGDIPSIGTPSVPDYFYLAFYPACFCALILLLRARLGELRASLGLDGLIAAGAIAALGVALLGQKAFTPIEGGALANAVHLAYPVGDVGLVSIVVGVLALAAWRPGRTWTLLGASLLLSATGDAAYLHLAANGNYAEGTILDSVWPASLLLLAYAAWQPAERLSAGVEGARTLALPSLFALLSSGLLFYATIQPGEVSMLAVSLAQLTLLFVIVRMGVTVRENFGMLSDSRAEALTDSLTGLGNRRRLMRDLEREVEAATAAAPRLLLLYDLDGFKPYNDGYGHLAGDSLLTRLGHRLGSAVRLSGEAYRLGGDEFCVLVRINDVAADSVAAAAAVALSDHGTGFAIGSSHGAALIPEEATDARSALQIADRRMYASKDGRPGLSRRPTADILRQVLAERSPEYVAESCGFADLAETVGRQLVMTGKDLDDLTHAAELHDIGKAAIPEALLKSPGELDDDERLFVRRHPVIGERLLDGSPAMHEVARLVRASHENYDGSGHPDGLAGGSIPLGSRIVAVCDAFYGLTSSRPYLARLSQDQALEQLRRCAGTQFDPAVVEVFCREIESRASKGESAATIRASGAGRPRLRAAGVIAEAAKGANPESGRIISKGSEAETRQPPYPRARNYPDQR